MDLDRLDASEALLAVKCFRTPFVGDAHSAVYEQIQHLRDLVDEDLHYSVYTAIVQTSCTGKSRAVMEMAQLGVYVCYCSCASVTASAYPPRTALLADKLVKTFDERGMVLYIKAWLQVLISALDKNVSSVEWKDMQLEADGNSNQIAAAVLKTWTELECVPANSMDVDDERIMDRDTRNESLLIAELQQLSAAFQDRLSVVFVFDEARGLHVAPGDAVATRDSPFCQIRRALRTFFSYPTFFALMLDTAAKISNLVPKRENEDSSRALKIGVNLLPPIYYLPNMMLNVPRPGLHMTECVRPEVWLRYGRPVWAARIDQDLADGAVNGYRKVLLFARQKLMGNVKTTYEDMSQSQGIALLSAVAGLDICPRCYLADSLAASHMNLVLRISNDRSMIFVTLPSEPILSEAAANVMRRSFVQRIALKHMLSACASGYVTGGPRGEFVAKFILVAAIWSLKPTSERWFLRPIKVADFMRKLLVNGSHDARSFQDLGGRLPAGGLVFFNSFAVVEQPPDVAVLEKQFVSGHAIMYSTENNLPGCDIIIPVWTPNGMTCIVISVKNVRNRGWMKKPSIDKLKCEFTQVQVSPNLPVVTLTMSLQEPKVADPTDWLLWQEPEYDGHTHITCYGMDRNYCFLDREVKQLLRKVLVTVPDPMFGASSKEVEWIKNLLPERYHVITRPYLLP